MTVIAAADGGLIVHSPVAWNESLAGELAALGEVRAVIAPNLMHNLYLGPWRQHYPEARRLAAPGFAARYAGAGFETEISTETVQALDAELDVVLIEGMPRINECVFLHRPSLSLIVADLVFNLQDIQGWWPRIFFGLNGVYRRLGPSRLFRVLIKDRAAVRRSLDRALSWEFDRIVVGHGDNLEQGGQEALRSAYDWLDSSARLRA